MLAAAYEASHGGMTHIAGFTPWDQKYTRHTGGKHEGVATEWRYAEILSCYNSFMDADAPGIHAMANASVFRRFPLADRYPQTNRPTVVSLRAKGYLTEAWSVSPRNYASIYVGDYDSAAWLYQRLPAVWDDPARGQVPLGWAFNPALAERFPVGLAYTRSTASPSDTFIAGDSGFGYLNPGYLVPPRMWSALPSGLGAWEAVCREGYCRWDLRVTGFVIDGNAPPMSAAVKAAYARFSPGGVVAQNVPRTSLVEGVPFLRMNDDLENPEEGAHVIAAAFPRKAGATNFGIFRTKLWTPTAHKQMFDSLRRDRADIEVVKPHTLLELLRRHLDRHAQHGRDLRGHGEQNRPAFPSAGTGSRRRPVGIGQGSTASLREVLCPTDSRPASAWALRPRRSIRDYFWGVAVAAAGAGAAAPATAEAGTPAGAIAPPAGTVTGTITCLVTATWRAT